MLNTKIMGILNVTPDSFYDAGRYYSEDAAYERALEIESEGAFIVDVGGESSRPGCAPVPVEEEKNRVIPLIGRIRAASDVMISCDTRKPEIAGLALNAGADMLNDIGGFGDPEMRAIAAKSGAYICIMHMQGNPRNMQINPQYGDVLKEIRAFLYGSAQKCIDAGVDPSRIIIDPGIGFGKTLEQNLRIISNIKYFKGRYPVLVGLSRKSFLEKMLGISVNNRLAGSLSAEYHCVVNGVDFLRVHDVKETYEMIQVASGLLKYRGARDGFH